MRLLGLLACALPRPHALAAGRAVADLLWVIAQMLGHGDFVPSHVRAARPGWSRRIVRTVARESVRGTLASVVELLRMPRWQAEGRQLVRLEGHEELAGLLERGRGAVIVTAHYGNWELLAATVARDLGPMTVLIQPPSQPAFRRLFDELHARAGVRAHSNQGPASLRPVLAALRSGELVGLVCDQHAEGSGVEATFLGHLVRVPTGAFQLARRTGAALVPVRIVRNPDDTHVVLVEPPLPLREDDTALAQDMMDRFAAWIDERPDHWLWIHDRWAHARPREESGTLRATLAMMALTASLVAAPLAVAAPRRLPPPSPPPPVTRQPVLAARADRIEVLWPGRRDLRGRIALPAPPEAWLPLPDRQALLVHLPSKGELRWIDLASASPSRFQTVRTIKDDTLEAYDLQLERVAERVLIGTGRLVLGELDLKTGSWNGGFDRPDQTGHFFRPWQVQPWQGGFLTLGQGQLRFETGRPDPRFRGPEIRVVTLPHPVVAYLPLAREGDVAVLCRQSDGRGALLRIAADTLAVEAVLPLAGSPRGLGRLDSGLLGVVDGTDLVSVDVRSWKASSRERGFWGPAPPLRVLFPQP
ncbi:MAG: lysophospholipid acyltransferase family protein [Candidatus Sericytochromatia bacterium]|nr:lysophospholipid acyltransferase family protein [Candidatus Sericytochromatia bacterium]